MSIIRKAALGAALGAAALTASTPAMADRYYGYRHHDGDATGAAIAGGVIGLALGAAIASSNNDRYYDRGYYDRGYYPRYRSYYVYRDYPRYYRPYRDDWRRHEWREHRGYYGDRYRRGW